MTLEQYLAGLTGEQMRAAVLKFWTDAGGQDTGVETIELWRAGQARLRFEPLVAKQPTAKPPLVGTVVKTITLKPYKTVSIAEAIKLGKYDGFDGDIVRLFADDEVGLTAAVNVTMVLFGRVPFANEVLDWAKANGDKKPILPKHIHAIGIQHREEQRKAPIVALGSVRAGYVLCLFGDSDWRSLVRGSVSRDWDQSCLFGFLSE